jgi:ATP-dependent RNA helicase HelY
LQGKGKRHRPERGTVAQDRRPVGAAQAVPYAEVRPLRKPRRINPDAFQRRALAAALEGRDVLVVAPTGAGKTWVAEQVAGYALERGVRLIYASPIKALSNQKYREFAARFGVDNAGILTGDVGINAGAPILVVTTEIFRNQCLESPEDLTEVRWAVLDEFHLLDSERGAAWEEAVIFAPPYIRLLCLSATVPNYEEVAGWIEYARGSKVEVVVEHRRPVPLAWYWFWDGRVLNREPAARLLQNLVREAAGRKDRRVMSR